jgi:hypothetical protein
MEEDFFVQWGGGYTRSVDIFCGEGAFFDDIL